MNQAKPKSILLAWYYDYHIFGFVWPLITKLLGSGTQVTLLTCDPKIQAQAKDYLEHPEFTLAYKPYLRPLMRAMDYKVLRPFIWMIGWVWSFVTARAHDLIIVPRDTQPFQHMITAHKPSLVCRPALGFDDKIYLQHKYTDIVEFPDIMQFANQKVKAIDTVFGGTFLKTARGPQVLKHYTVTGTDIKEFFVQLGSNPDHVHVTGNPNYELLQSQGALEEVVKTIRAAHSLPEGIEIYTLFTSQQSFTGTELQNFQEYACQLFIAKPDAVLCIKTHPKMGGEALAVLKSHVQTLQPHKIKIIDNLPGDTNNIALITMSVATIIEESNVGLMAAQHGKPVIIIDLDGPKDGPDNFYRLFDGLTYAPTPDALAHSLTKNDFASPEPQIIDAQNKMLERVCMKTLSPCQNIVDRVSEILQHSTKG